MPLLWAEAREVGFQLATNVFKIVLAGRFAATWSREGVLDASKAKKDAKMEPKG